MNAQLQEVINKDNWLEWPDKSNRNTFSTSELTLALSRYCVESVVILQITSKDSTLLLSKIRILTTMLMILDYKSFNTTVIDNKTALMATK